MPAIDTLKLAKSLREHGVDELAEGIAEGINEGLGVTLSTLSTKSDITLLKTELSSELKLAEARLTNEISSLKNSMDRKFAVSAVRTRNLVLGSTVTILLGLGIIQHFFK